MCKLVTVIKNNDKNNSLIKKTIQAQEHVMVKEPHGIAAMIVDKQNKVKIKKSMKDYEGVFKWLYQNLKGARVASVHTRQATSGTLNEKNLHYFNIDNYYFAHNGIVGERGNAYGYSSKEGKQGYWHKIGKSGNHILVEGEEVKQEEMCDSYEFLSKLPKPMNREDIMVAAYEEDFYGVGMILDKKKKRVFTFGTRDIPVHTDFNSYLISYSFDPTNKLTNNKKFWGLEMKGDKEDEVKLKKEVIVEGFYETNY